MKTTQNPIVPHLWFDTQAKEAVNFYVSLFPHSEIKDITTIHGTPSGDADMVTFKLHGQDFMAISAGPVFVINPSISFYVYCGSEPEIDRVYHALVEGGNIMMPLDKYPWSERYAWVQDRFGVSWQLDVAGVESQQKIVPALLFVNDKVAKVKEAIKLYTSIFDGSEVMFEAPYPPAENMPEGSVLFAQVKLGNYLINAMSGKGDHNFDFNEAVSLIVYCDDQEEIDYYWKKFTAGGQEQPCGWVKDKFGVSWQIVPKAMGEMMSRGSKDQLERVTKAFLQMKKFNIKKLQEAFENE